MQPAIRVENVSKQFRLGTRQAGGYRTLRETIIDTARAPLARLRRRGGPPAERRPAEDTDALWALKDVSLEIQPGEVVGLIGRNGAGKSTLLKVLSRITEPTAGRVELRGRVGSLLEVGTGFHPELTGRENVYLNGSILGMSRKEIDRKFDEIVAFAEMERFLDTPVKRYSSGMYVRLAFAVAAHLEPEILLVDEVLAVGDAAFQRRCLDRMRELAQSGRTILFVSHNTDQVPRLCTRALLLNQGRVTAGGPAREIVDHYLAELAGPGVGGDLTDIRHRGGDGRARFTRVHAGRPGGPGGLHRSGDDLTVRIEITAAARLDDVSVAVNLRAVSGTRVHSGWTKEQDVSLTLWPGNQALECTFHRVCVRPGQTLDVELWMASGSALDQVPEALRIAVLDGDDTDSFSSSPEQGVVLVPVTWRVLRPAAPTPTPIPEGATCLPSVL